MAPERWLARLCAPALVVLCALALTPAAHALRVVDYNLTNYPSVLFPQRQPYFRTVMSILNADVVVSEEVRSQAGVDSFRTNVLNVLEPGQWLSAPFIDGNDTDNALFYKPSKVQLLGSWAFYPNPANLLRLVGVYRLKPVGYSDASAEFRIYAQHLKASTGTTNVNQRAAEAIGIRDSMNAMPLGTAAILTGDFNIYTTTEPAFQKFLENQIDNDGRLYDPLNLSGTFNQGGFAPYHTQCPCLSCPTGSGFSGGGLDDRFDMFLPTANLNDGDGLDLVPGTYKPVGNDGLHYNLNITDAPTIPEGSAYATALWNASDHLPIRVDLQVPAKISLPASLAFGSVIVGATANQNLAVSNPAVVPADNLVYSLSADPGFTAPGSQFSLNAGSPPANHTIGMDTSTPGVLGGFLLVSANDPDNGTPTVTLTGTVLDHAQASLDSTSALLSENLDFGTHDTGGFSTLMARVHNRGYGTLRARLALNGANITGGDGRFSIVGGFTPGLVSGTARTETIAFNDAGATQDLDYNATLTFTSADEALPGATAQPDLTVSLHAKVSSSTVGVPGPTLPSVTRLYAPYPNPVTERAQVRLDLAAPADVALEIHDVQGRRIATLVQGELPAGRYEYPWDARGEHGARLGAGLYFIRLSIAGRPVEITRLALVR